MRKKNYIYVEQEDQLKDLLAQMRQAERIAVDTESSSLYCYYDKVCLLQLNVNDENYIVDPLVGLDLSRFLKILAEKPLILHAADNDLRMLHTQFGFFPKRHVFDTMIAAKILGHDQMGLAALVNKYFHLVLSKKGQKANWSKRPITEDLLQYASDDTRYLLTLADKLLAELKNLDREDWHSESCERMIQATTEVKKPDPDGQWRISGTGAVKGRRTLVFIREIWRWRDTEAQKVDKPAYMIMGNKQLLDLASWAVTQRKNSKWEMQNLPGNCIGKRLDALVKALQKAEQLPSEKWPDFRKPQPYYGPDFKPEIEALRLECAQIAKELKLDPSVLAPKAMVASIARHHATTVKEMMACSPIMIWQAKLLEPGARRVFAQNKK